MGKRKYKVFRARLTKIAPAVDKAIKAIKEAERLLGCGDCEESRSEQLKYHIKKLEDAKAYAAQEIASITRVLNGEANY